MPVLPIAILPDVLDAVALFFLVIVGLVILFIVAKAISFALPGAIVAFVVWLLTSSLFLAGVAFLVIALISVARR